MAERCYHHQKLVTLDTNNTFTSQHQIEPWHFKYSSQNSRKETKSSEMKVA